MYYTDNYDETVIKTSRKWINGEAIIKGADELYAMCEHYGIKAPHYIRYFGHSTKPGHVYAVTAQKSLLSLLDKLRIEIESVSENV